MLAGPVPLGEVLAGPDLARDIARTASRLSLLRQVAAAPHQPSRRLPENALIDGPVGHSFRSVPNTTAPRAHPQVARTRRGAG
ncbi:hypothetical protein [Amycolatopsis cynarae]|uniref:hypothetical protein n=1 Tax=Amycolatopsis cynarae TaxID=2995223 RepID=UPI003899685D